jgi:hypothetical protein
MMACALRMAARPSAVSSTVFLLRSRASGVRESSPAACSSLTMIVV